MSSCLVECVGISRSIWRASSLSHTDRQTDRHSTSQLAGATDAADRRAAERRRMQSELPAESSCKRAQLVVGSPSCVCGNVGRLAQRSHALRRRGPDACPAARRSLVSVVGFTLCCWRASGGGGGCGACIVQLTRSSSRRRLVESSRPRNLRCRALERALLR